MLVFLFMILLLLNIVLEILSVVLSVFNLCTKDKDKNKVTPKPKIKEQEDDDLDKVIETEMSHPEETKKIVPKKRKILNDNNDEFYRSRNEIKIEKEHFSVNPKIEVHKRRKHRLPPFKQEDLTWEIFFIGDNKAE